MIRDFVKRRARTNGGDEAEVSQSPAKSFHCQKKTLKFIYYSALSGIAHC